MIYNFIDFVRLYKLSVLVSSYLINFILYVAIVNYPVSNSLKYRILAHDMLYNITELLINQTLKALISHSTCDC
jgi:hypothetical protein